jgi:hypothetical protein
LITSQAQQPRSSAAERHINARTIGKHSHRGFHGVLLRAVGLLAIMLLGSGCATAAFGSTFSAQGTATHTLTVIFERGSVPDADIRRLERHVTAAEGRAQADGYTTERIETSTQLGIRISGTTRDIVDTGAALNGLYNSLVREASGPIAPFVGTFDRESTAVGGTSFVLDLSANGDMLFRSIQEMGPGSPELESPANVAEILALSYTATMPGTLRSTDGEQIDASTVRWVISVEGVTPMRATSAAGRDTPWALITIIIIAALAIVAVVGAAIAWLMLHRHRRGRASIPLVAPLSAEGAEITASSDPTDVTMQDVGASLARAVEHVIEGSSTADVLAVEVEESERRAESPNGPQPEGN